MLAVCHACSRAARREDKNAACEACRARSTTRRAATEDECGTGRRRRLGPSQCAGGVRIRTKRSTFGSRISMNRPSLPLTGAPNSEDKSILTRGLGLLRGRACRCPIMLTKLRPQRTRLRTPQRLCASCTCCVRALIVSTDAYLIVAIRGTNRRREYTVLRDLNIIARPHDKPCLACLAQQESVPLLSGLNMQIVKNATIRSLFIVSCVVS